MIFDLIAANGGRKYLFKNGVFSDITGGIVTFGDYISYTVDTDGVTFRASGAAYSLTKLNFGFKKSISLANINKIYFEFDYFNFPESAQYSAKTGFYVSSHADNSMTQSDPDLFVPVKTSDTKFTIELDVSGITTARYIRFMAQCNNVPSGLGARIRSISYV